ncbi:hypothetical protein TTHERM_00624380 (macronuclear) [Tetrahymena thermophila SB210]|uniref:Uncharacterized protein n=1 Tax=Tetrahymena thermophila (strain SB210) TaxID=312017 RepID=Q240U5_TETTS|nr:hypothetical protein TTHERM_00624380 [Tetrahymena thermophila SB210]EAS02319.4 hypothetical protein TTHERM_00624380 [Tetrahymena thermophila SB210]|eukprot:XP_001022564.4 hypothetical protein TTHERM_00624380 [Tetrahymena thermophila SB210]
MKSTGRISDIIPGNRRTETSHNQSIQGDQFLGDTQQTIQSINQQTINNNNIKNNLQMQMETDSRFKMSDSYQHLFKDINSYLEEIKKSAENNDDILKDMQQQSEKLGTCITYLRQFMFMHNIHFDNSKFLNEQNQQSEYESNTNLRNTNKSNTIKSQQKIRQQNTAFFSKSKASQVINNPSTQELVSQKRDKSPITNTNQQNYVVNQTNDLYQHQNSQQSQANPPSKLSNMLSSILQDRKSKPNANNSKSGIISTKKV